MSVIYGSLILLALNIFSEYTGVLVPLSQLSLSTSVALGLPGVAVLVVMSVLV